MFPLYHFLIPVIILRLLRVDKRLVFLLSPLAVIMDFDVFAGLHRLLFHNLVFIAFITILTILIFKRWYKVKTITGVSLFFLFTHIVLDYSGVALFWPFSLKFFGFDFASFRFFSSPFMKIGVSTISTLALIQILLVLVIYVFLFIEICGVKRLKEIFLSNGKHLKSSL